MATKSKTGQMVFAALMAALIAVLAQIMVPIGPVPFSMAIFGVFFAGAMLPPLAASASVAVYLLLGIVGLPVFTGFKGGPQVLLGPTGGYLAGYLVLALAVSLAVKHFRKWWLHALGALAGLLGCYALGTLWFMVLTGRGLAEALLLCVVPFILPDVAKAALALVLAQVLWRRMQPGRVAK